MNISFTTDRNPVLLARLNRTVHNKHAFDHPDVFKPHKQDEMEKWFRTFLQRENVFPVIMVVEGEAIGYALLEHQIPHPQSPHHQPEHEVIFVDQMSIEPAYQNQGYGLKLMDYIKRFAHRRGVKKIQLDVWSDNAQGKAFYLKAGFSTYREMMEINL
ncbi:MAG: GNAT family N-acetyltransferase [Bacteroidota bacterium]